MHAHLRAARQQVINSIFLVAGVNLTFIHTSYQIASLKEQIRSYDEKSRAAAAELREQARTLAARDEEIEQLRQAEAMHNEDRETNSQLEDERDQLSSQVLNFCHFFPVSIKLPGNSTIVESIQCICNSNVFDFAWTI